MQTKYLFASLALVISLFITACGGDEAEPVVLTPGAITLLTPSGNSTCFQGTTISGGKISSVNFSWKAASNAESYSLNITNLNTQTTTSYSVKSLSYNTSLDVNAYYAWSVTAVNGSGSSKSDTLKFYLSGTPASSYAPFPADLTAPASGAVVNANGAATVQVTFQWTGSDSDNDIAGYVFYLDSSDASTQVLSSTSATTTQTLATGKTYYWKVVTTDKSGNSSSSAVGSFQIK
jgi:hypothetical protein